MFNSKKGFTLIELLIVIAIIAVLAVAFLPTILGAPAKGRDTARIASLQKIQKVIVNADLEGRTLSIPANGACLPAAIFSATDIAAFGGTFPMDPLSRTGTYVNGSQGCAISGGKFLAKSSPGVYKFGLYSWMENCSAANTLCSTAENGTITAPTCSGANPTASTDWCYAILMAK